jgi:hypothetical protein
MTWKQFAGRLRDEPLAELERLRRLYKNDSRAAAAISAEFRARNPKRRKSCKSVSKTA